MGLDWVTSVLGKEEHGVVHDSPLMLSKRLDLEMCTHIFLLSLMKSECLLPLFWA